MSELTSLLQDAQGGDAAARHALFAAAYPELRRLAHARLQGSNRPTMLDTTALVHESFMRLQASQNLQASERRSFFAYAARVMRSVIVDSVRESLAQRRGGDVSHVPLDSELADRLGAPTPDEALRVHAALETLAEVEPRLAEGVEMRYFGGFTEAEVAVALGVTERTVRRDWEKARLLLLAMLS